MGFDGMNLKNRNVVNSRGWRRLKPVIAKPPLPQWGRGKKFEISIGL
jgi:hypothetical protein